VKLVSKNIEVGTHKVNATWTKEMAEDIMKMKSFDWEAAEEKMIQEIRIQERDRKIDKLLDEK
jgi:hypothetical protein